ncbi:DUF1499 domain-containing protein [Asticcacaulis sp. 201]|uniref:DUF1499 domain-containing protein n=1 Tax=Asticcacaulis sp. 201 TaxID=3028787 RepID=UPI0029160676|nr:DUF1499 domain-containing protein [Asticcacaulis sp. 201]MDV6332877.1 DUF1499 domain-containing protein [Asticcacaulis sp. 201]
MPDSHTPDAPMTANKPKKKGLAFAHLSFMVSVITFLFLLGTMMLTHLEYISIELGFSTLTLGIGPRMVMAALAVAGISLLISLFMCPSRCAPWAFASVLISGGMLGGYAWYHKELKDHPPIADVATNWDRPLSFSDKFMSQRGDNALPVEDLPRVPKNESMEWGGKTLAAINEATCPAAKTLQDRIIPEDQIPAIVKALKEKHYIVFGTSPWRIEATYQDNFYGFKSDIVIRIDPRSVDVRSISRINMPDLGANCRRVTEVLGIIKALPVAAGSPTPQAD